MLRHNQRSATPATTLDAIDPPDIEIYRPRWVRGHPFSELAHALSNSFEGERRSVLEIASEKETIIKRVRFYYFFFFVFVYLFFSFSLFYSNFGKDFWRVYDLFKCVWYIFMRDLWMIETKINTKVGVQKFRSRLVYLVIRNNWGFG